MAAEASIRVVFTSPYRGGTKDWSIRLHVTGGAWQDQAHFNTYSDNLTTPIRSVTSTRTTLKETVGYNPGSDVPVFSKTYNQVGTQALSGPSFAPLECCYLVRFTTTQRSAKNHPIYLFQYLHDAMVDAATTPDVPRADVKAAWQTRVNGWVAGISDGTLNRVRCGPNGAVAQSAQVETYLTHRDFPR